MTTTSTTTSTTTEDFTATKTFTSDPGSVYSALTDIDALTGWWVPAAGGAHAGETLRFLFGNGELVLLVGRADRPTRVRWDVLTCEPVPDWVGTEITFDLVPVGTGTELRFRHHGLNPGLECFDDCHAGWTHYLASLVGFVDHGAGDPNAPDERFAAWRAEHNPS
jgi:uncharacterized protein YndB with AHSA1/START domain